MDGTGQLYKKPVPKSFSHRKEGPKPKFIDGPYMDNNVAMLMDDVRTLSCRFESESRAKERMGILGLRSHPPQKKKEKKQFTISPPME